MSKSYFLPEISFNNINDLKNYTIDGANIGLGVVSSLMMITRDYNFNSNDYKELIDCYLNVAYTVYRSIDELQKIYKFDEIYMFNGRFGEYYPAIEYCNQNKIGYSLHDRGADMYKYAVVKNDLIHRFARWKEEIELFWHNNSNNEYKEKIARKWFNDRRGGVDQNWVSFTKNQKENALPTNFDKSKDNIAIFNSSFDEYAVFDDWQNPIEKNENILIENILKHYIDDGSKHFYLRVHPNLKNVVTSQMREIDDLKAKNYKNFTIIYPDEVIDSYALMNACKKTVVSSSTVGVETTYWGNVSIGTGKAMYDSFDCVYKANNYDELYSLIDSDLNPKPKENTYKYGYWAAEYGIPFKYFEPNGLFHGKFLGVDLRKKPIWVKIRLAIQKLFKK